MRVDGHHDHRPVRPFSATPPEVVEAIVFNGRVSTIDRATGKPARPHLLSVSAERSIFQDLVLAAVDPAACLIRLNALVSPNPFDMEAVEPDEFEYLVKDLFLAMGAEAWNTFPSKDGGVDAVAVSKHLAFGGVCFIQAKDLLKKHLNLDVIPGTTPPRRLHASENTQTGRPGPVQ